MGALDRVFRSRRPSQQRPDEAIIGGLWRNGEQGGFMDPRDIDRYMAMRGPELFNAAAPSLFGESQNLGGGAVRVYTSAGAYSAIATPAGSTVPGKRYVVEGTVTAIGAAGAGLVVDSRENPPISALGPFRFVVTATGSYLAIKRNGAVLTDFTLSGVTVREWLGEASCTMWQDAVGTLPVVSAGQPIGLWLDKRKGLVRGPELLTNGDFSAGAASWGVSGADATHIATFANGALRYQSDTTSPVLLVTQLLQGGMQIVAGKWYEVIVVVSNWVSGGIKTDTLNGNVASGLTLAQGPGTYRTVGLATSTTSGFTLTRNSTNVDLTIDSISIRELPGNHAYMTTTTARATLSARYNLLTNTNWAGAAPGAPGTPPTGWAGNFNTAAITGVSQLGSDYAIQITAAAQRLFFAQTFNAAAGTTYSLSCLLLENSGLPPTQIIGLTSQPSGSTITWYVNGSPFDSNAIPPAGARLELRLSVGATAGVPAARFGIGAAVNATGVVSIAQPDVRVTGDGIGLPPYQRVVSPSDLDTSGFPWYVLPDGVDDMFETAAVDMSGSAAITYATAVRRARDTGLGCVVEATSNYSTSNGTFILLAPGVSDTPSVAWNAKGSALAGGMSISTAAAPVSSVIVATANIETAERTLSVNDTSLTNSTSIGTGTLGNHKLYFFQRGSGGMAFSGRIYGWIWVARALSKAEINAIRRFFRTTARIY